MVAVMMGPSIRIGLPYAADGRLASATRGLQASTLISVGSMFRGGRFTPVGNAAWTTPAALDSAGFTAMLKGGYRWTVAEYVEFVVTNSGDGAMPFPWEWWSAMDYCCEPQIVQDRAEIERRMALNDVPDPMPILQGRTADDYAACAVALAAVCRDGTLPTLVGVGSVCRRELRGPEGLLTVLERLDRELPHGVRLHLFGVKGALLAHLEPYLHRIASVDSMAWDFDARQRARKAGVPNDTEHRAECMTRWYAAQRARLDGIVPTVDGVGQLMLFRVGAS